MFELFGSQRSLVMHLKNYLNIKYSPVTYLFVPYFCKLTCTSIVQKHIDDQFLHDFVTTYDLCISMNNLIDYKTHL